MTTIDPPDRIQAPPQKGIVDLANPAYADAGGPGIDWGEILAALWRRRFRIAAGTALVLAAGLTYALLATPLYRAQSVLLPREDSGGLGVTGQLRQFSGLAALAGIDIGANGKQEAIGILRSRGFASRFVLSNRLVPVLEAASWSFLPAARDSERKTRLIVDRFVRDVLSITEDKKNGLVTVAIKWRDPAIAADWANRLVAQINEEMKSRTLQESETNIRYLTQQLKVNDIAAIQQSIGRLLEIEMQKMMLAKGSEDFAFRVVDVADLPARRDSPKRWLIAIASIVAGLGGSIVLVLLGPPLRRICVRSSTP